MLGLLNYTLSRYAEAEVYFRKTIEIEPHHVHALNSMSGLFIRMNRFTESEYFAKKATELKPDFFEAQYNLGYTLAKLKRFDEAVIIYKLIIKNKPNFFLAHINLGRTYVQLKRTEEAEVIFKKVLELEPNNIKANNNLGNLLILQNKVDEALAIYNKTLKIKPDHKETLINRGIILFKKSEWALALIDFDNCNTKFSRGFALSTLYAQGNIDEIYNRIEINEKLDSDNKDVAAFSAFISNKEKRKTANKFCNNPLDFVKFSNISLHLKNSSSYITKVIEELHNVKKIWEPLNLATIKGFQSGNSLFRDPPQKLSKLRSIILNELDLYRLKFKDETCDLIKELNDMNNKKIMYAWYVILKKQGYQNAHIHRSALLSGVIYLKTVPSHGKNEGAIEFNLNGVHYFDSNSPKLIHNPEIGDIVIFPSSLHHRTIPFSTDSDRITISFDLCISSLQKNSFFEK